ncbi:MAG: DUF5329 domain-containing protein [Desulfobulbaceae bacterium]|nr:DUF5329 domain-containing protein [Desulfobulbaceae bacterium]
MNKCIRCFLILLLFAAGSVFPAAGLAAGMEDEITYLLYAIEHSECIFIRNGSSHDPKEARAHIEKKYNYLKKRIKTTEDFIKGAATKSSLSGRPYMMNCGGKEIQTADWLRTELEQYRSRERK